MTDQPTSIAEIDVHLNGTFHCVRSVVGHMIERNYGRIITVTSAAGIVGTLGQVDYAAAKGGMVALTKSLARELGRYRITANSGDGRVATGRLRERRAAYLGGGAP